MIIKNKDHIVCPIEKGDLVVHNLGGSKSSGAYGLALTGEVDGSVLVRWLNPKKRYSEQQRHFPPTKYYASLLSIVAKGKFIK